MIIHHLRTPEIPWRWPWRAPLAHLMAAMAGATRFDWPIGTPHGGLAYNAQPFGVRDVSPYPHLGDDLNGCYGYNTDLGDPVRAIGNGLVIDAGHRGRGWGNCIIVLHAIRDSSSGAPPRYVQSFYGHLQTIRARVGEFVWRGQQIGTIGNADGAYYAHLHLELREFTNPFVGTGYRESLEGWINPVKFIAEHRGAQDDDLDRELGLIFRERILQNRDSAK